MLKATYSRVHSDVRSGNGDQLEEHELAARDSQSSPEVRDGNNGRQPSPGIESTTVGAKFTKPATGRRHRSARSTSALLYAILDFLIALPAVYFLAFGLLARAWDRTPALPEGTGLEPDNLITAAKLNPTIFPIAFAAIVGRFLKAVAAWKIERDASILSLEQLLNCKTVVSAVILPIKLRRVDILAASLIVLWAISPLGGQSSQRVVTSGFSTAHSPANISYLDTNSPYPSPSGGSDPSFSPGSSAAYNAALVSPLSARNGKQDAFNNVKIPMIEYTQASSATDTFQPFPGDDDEMVWSSLLGIPVVSAQQGTLPSDGSLVPFDGVSNTTFNLESSYWNLNCAAPIHMPFPPDYGSSDVSLFSNFSNGSYPHTTTYESGSGKMLIGLADHTATSNDPRIIYLESMDSNGATHVECNLTTSYVESTIRCVDGTCEVTGIRRSLSPLTSPNFSMLDFETTAESLVENFLNSTSLYQNSISADPNQVYLANDSAPFFSSSSGDDWAPDLFKVDPKDIQVRFGQLLNTVWLAGLSANAITGHYTPTVTSQPPFPFVSSFATPDPFYFSRYATADVQQTTIVLICHRQWLVILIISSLTMLLAGLSTIFLELARHGPDILDSFSSLVRDSRYFGAEGDSTRDGSDLTRAWGEKKVRLGDVTPEQEFGHIAIGMAAGKGAAQRLSKGRLYD